MKEEWKQLGTGKYSVSNHGRIRGVRKILKTFPQNAGYHIVRYRPEVGGPHTCRTVHTLVAEAFIGPRPTDGKWDVAHRDHNKDNNRVDNLFYQPHLDNVRDSAKYKGLEPHCRECGIDLMLPNVWTPSFKKIVNRVCKKCHARSKREMYHAKKKPPLRDQRGPFFSSRV